MIRTRRMGGPLTGRGGFQPRAVFIIALAWCLMWDRLSVGNALNGVLVGLLVTIVFPLPSIDYSGRPRPIGMLVLLGRFLSDLTRASVHVAFLALRAAPPPRGAIVEVRLRTRSDLYLTLVAVLVALVPGSVIIDVRRAAGVLYVHDIDGSDLDASRARVLRVERRLVRAFGSDAEIALVEAEEEEQ